MATLEGLRRQIDTAKDLGSVVTTMKTLAAVSIHQYERAVEALADYNKTIEMGFQIVLKNEPFQVDPGPHAGRTGVVVFGSDQGMCGQFNEEIVSYVVSRSNDGAEPRWVVHVVGARAEGQLLDAGWPVDHAYEAPTSVTDVGNLVLEILPNIQRLRVESEVSRLRVFYNRPTSASSFEPCELQLLPIDPASQRRWQQANWESRSLPMYKTGRRRLLSRLVQQYLFVSLFRACAESLASENASRIAAMQAAEKNIEERLDDLSGAYNQLRQTAITEELLDVVTGFEALSQQTD